MKKWFVFVAVLALLVAHQDYWQWARTDLVWGFVPYNMAYHIGIALVTSLMWLVVCTFCWPEGLDDIQVEKEESESP